MKKIAVLIALILALTLTLASLTGFGETLGTAQGSPGYSITPGTDVTVANAGNVSNDYKVSGLTFYNKPGFMYNGVFFAASGNDISLTLASSATDKVADGYQASAGTLSGIGTSYTLAMPSSDVTISAASWYPALLPDEGGNYSVNNANDWESFCLMVANGNSFNGKTVKLTTDISVTRKCGIVSGNTQVNAFSGTFDGQGKTITATITDNSNQGTAPHLGRYHHLQPKPHIWSCRLRKRHQSH